MIIKVCPVCKGDGFWRADPLQLHPLTNIANATAIYFDGSRRPAVEAGGLMCVAFEFPCIKCRGVGEQQWNRGKSLTPA